MRQIFWPYTVGQDLTLGDFLFGTAKFTANPANFVHYFRKRP